MNVGDDISGYRLELELAAGPTALFLGRHRLLGRPAAIRVIAPRAADPVAIESFFARVRAAAAISHPGLVRVLDDGHAADGSAYAIAEFLDGESLASRLRRRGRLAPVEAVRLARQIAQTLAVCHRAGIAHGALEPGKVFLVPDSRVEGSERARLLDFGAAGLRGGAEPTAAGDVRALGILLFQLLCGRKPFAGPRSPERAARVSDLGGPIELDRIVAATLAGDPARRPSMAAIANALAAVEPPSALAPEEPPPRPARAEPSTPVSAPPPPLLSGRGWWIGGAIATAIAIAAAAAAFLLVL